MKEEKEKQVSVSPINDNEVNVSNFNEVSFELGNSEQGTLLKNISDILIGEEGSEVECVIKKLDRVARELKQHLVNHPNSLPRSPSRGWGATG